MRCFIRIYCNNFAFNIEMEKTFTANTQKHTRTVTLFIWILLEDFICSRVNDKNDQKYREFKR